MWKSQNKWMRMHGHGHGRRGTERDVRVLATNWFGGTWQWQRRWRRRLLCLNTTTWAIIKTSQVKWSCKNLSRSRSRSRCNHKFYASSWDSFFKKALAHYFGFHDWFRGLMLVHWLVSAKAHVGSCRGWVCTRSLVILVYRREITKNLDPLCSTPLYNGKLSPPALLLFSLFRCWTCTPSTITTSSKCSHNLHSFSIVMHRFLFLFLFTHFPSLAESRWNKDWQTVSNLDCVRKYKWRD